MNLHEFPAMEEVQERIRRASHLLLALDYDGTLTPIVDEPSEAFLSPSMRRQLASLASRPHVSLAIISGRARADLEERVAIADAIYAGNHGLEIHGPGFEYVDHAALGAASALSALAADLERRLRSIEGIIVENKQMTLSVHYRKVARIHHEEVRRIILDALQATDNRCQLTMGAKVYEVRPHRHWHKGVAVNWIKAQLHHPESLVIYMGDDVTDEDAFAALDDAVTIKVGDSTETAADYILPSPAVVETFLRWVDELVREKMVPEAE